MNDDDIKTELVAMEAALAGVASEHFDFTDSDARVFEKGYYRIAYARPKKRMARSLGVDREILTLITNFPEQQARTIAAARTWIKNSATGRLEPYHVIIVHSDPRGNEKLRSWGREQGLIVVPLLASELDKTGQDFERLVAEQVFQWNPFEITGPVADDAQFYGRRDDAIQFAHRLQSGQIVSFFGIRKIGKTSLLNRIIAMCRDKHDCTIVMMDCSQDAVWSNTAAGLLSALEHTIRSAAASAQTYVTVSAGKQAAGLVQASTSLSTQVLAIDKPLLLFIDEVDYITPGSSTAHSWRSEFIPFWRNLRAISQEALRQQRKFSIVVSGVASKWFSLERIDNIENAALSFVPEIYLGPLPIAATTSMVRDLGARCGLRFDKESAEYLSSECGGMPFWVRKACSWIHRDVDIGRRPYELARPEVALLLQRFISAEGSELARIAISHLFSLHPELVAACRTTADTSSAASSLDRLQQVLANYGVFTMRDGKFVMPTIVRAGWELFNAVPVTAPLAQVAKDSFVEDEAALNDWAEDLAIIGKRRNVIERKLRRVLLGLMRAEVLQNKAGALPLLERIKKAVPTARHASLKTDPDDLMDQLYWLELVSLVEHEWRTMQTVFGDLEALKTHGLTVNERPDAHAKQFERFDLAGWNRALKWFEDRLVRV